MSLLPLRFVRREKEISETKAEALETESMRYRQRAEHLQRDLDETKAALELEFERTKGRMLTEAEFKDINEKVKKAKEFEMLNKELEKQKNNEIAKGRSLLDKVCFFLSNSDFLSKKIKTTSQTLN